MNDFPSRNWETYKWVQNVVSITLQNYIIPTRLTATVCESVNYKFTKNYAVQTTPKYMLLVSIYKQTEIWPKLYFRTMSHVTCENKLLPNK